MRSLRNGAGLALALSLSGMVWAAPAGTDANGHLHAIGTRVSAQKMVTPDLGRPAPLPSAALGGLALLAAMVVHRVYKRRWD